MLNCKGSITAFGNFHAYTCTMPTHKYLTNYPPSLITQVESLINNDRLENYLLGKYPKAHNIANDGDLRDYVVDLKNQYMKK